MRGLLDTINHNSLLSKLKQGGLDSTSMSYLYHRYIAGSKGNVLNTNVPVPKSEIDEFPKGYSYVSTYFSNLGQ